MTVRAKEKAFCSKNILSGERGAALIIALLIMVVLTVLGTMAIMVTATDIRISGNYRQAQECFYMADACIELSKCLILNHDSHIIQHCTEKDIDVNSNDDIIKDPSFRNETAEDNLIMHDKNYDPDIQVNIGPVPVDIDIDVPVHIAPGFSPELFVVKIFTIDSVASRDANVCSNVQINYQSGKKIEGGL
ncbi:MAG: pilus assembly PilX N-terminal domain-containing protein [Nitrospinota bacterium]